MSINKMSVRVQPFSVNEYKQKDYFGEEPGTPEFYMVSDTLNKYLGKENIWVSWDYTDFCFIIEQKDNNNTFDYKIIESIYEPFEPYNFIYKKNDHLVFEII